MWTDLKVNVFSPTSYNKSPLNIQFKQSLDACKLRLRVDAWSWSTTERISLPHAFMKMLRR